ncbi:DUF1275 family protein [Polynucleobacter sp. AP-Melu-500A-A1]|uniref:DUF1275 family protein n=1 Tax=Polynucleobacter sp. AP-Melu-500A-A1 TaxID=2576929 RepID=UPI002105AFB2|nr:YoaK family protein [Polynucleobacter sp. AP-Melu-500A-A1]MBU3631686.1 DUF1275 domain-containing protein [Polynucleobacter sp. AP-Melu-500A-A1]
MLNQRLISAILGFTGGYMDTAGFLALNGLFTAHITGNLVTLGAALATGYTGYIDKALAIPVFCLTILLFRFLRRSYFQVDRILMSRCLTLHALLLLIGSILAIEYGPFVDGNSLVATLTGLIFVAGMTIHNTIHRVFLPETPPTTVMTLTTTQIMLDCSDLIHGATPDEKIGIYKRLKSLIPAVLLFSLGCAGGAIAYKFLNMGCFLIAALIMCFLAIKSRVESSIQIS